ncbi:hypothetical protein [Teichococcus aestuarii]|uniref:hypothetical protein n=1 Tax=Teichococcus aestuarii TaxID=568898 RepID=UPI003618E5DF
MADLQLQVRILRRLPLGVPVAVQRGLDLSGLFQAMAFLHPQGPRLRPQQHDACIELRGL